MTPANPLPRTCAIAFKEWSGVCRALGDGRQSLILRKGGIAEGPGGFVPEHDVFWLYPTRVHEQQQGLRVPADDADGGDGGDAPPAARPFVEIGTLVATELVDYVDSPDRLIALGDLHVWTEETATRRFFYRRPGLWVLGVRVFRLPEPFPLDVTPEHSGCRTWVPLDPPVETAGAAPVLDDDDFARRMEHLRAALTPRR